MDKKNEEKLKYKTKFEKVLKKIVFMMIIINAVFYTIIIYDSFFFKTNSYYSNNSNSEILEEDDIVVEVSNDLEILELNFSNALKIDINEIIESNAQNITEEIYTVTEVLEYTTSYTETSLLPLGTLEVIQEGREGIKEITYKNTYINGELISEEEVTTKITKSNVEKIVQIGTNESMNITQVEVGDYVYSSSDRLEVKVNPDTDSEKVATLEKDSKLLIEEILDDWYKISSGTVHGYVKKESTTSIYESIVEELDDSYSTDSSGSITAFSFNMNLNILSGLSLEQFESVLTDSKDINNIFSENAKYFYYIEQQYSINGIFVAAVAIHESGWGTSNISISKNNLFGYGAYDSSPYSSAYDFSDYSESIDLLARVFVKYYLNPEGTEIYSGEIATGQYYNGNTISSVNIKYATDTNWANAVYSYMSYLYNKL